MGQQVPDRNPEYLLEKLEECTIPRADVNYLTGVARNSEYEREFRIAIIDGLTALPENRAQMSLVDIASMTVETADDEVVSDYALTVLEELSEDDAQ